ncbi:hypothetical protein [Tessaracoccus sp.]
MCKSAAEGGQRCHGHAATALAAATTKQEPLGRAVRAITTEISGPRDVSDGEVRIPHDLFVQERTARFAMEDALVRFASTPQGEAELQRRMHTLCGVTSEAEFYQLGRRQGALAPPKNPFNPNDPDHWIQ